MKLVSAILDARPHHYGAISIREWKILSGVCVVFLERYSFTGYEALGERPVYGARRVWYHLGSGACVWLLH